MSYIDGFIASVPNENKEKYIEHAKIMAAVLKENGALKIVDTWGEDVPDGELTSFPMAVKKEENETVIFSWVVWPSKAVREAAWEKAMQDPRMDNEKNPMPFDGKRIVYGGFDVVSEV